MMAKEAHKAGYSVSFTAKSTMTHFFEAAAQLSSLHESFLFSY